LVEPVAVAHLCWRVASRLRGRGRRIGRIERLDDAARAQELSRLKRLETQLTICPQLCAEAISRQHAGSPIESRPVAARHLHDDCHATTESAAPTVATSVARNGALTGRTRLPRRLKSYLFLPKYVRQSGVCAWSRFAQGRGDFLGMVLRKCAADR